MPSLRSHCWSTVGLLEVAGHTGDLNGSVASVKGTPAFGVYGATEAALRSFVRTWTLDLKDRHIRSNSD
jgi:NAD(P)-dependent dehydrogenase (short-subunit alcohol dehydrogenase family)